MKFTVTVYHGDDPEDNVLAYDDKIIHSATRLGSTTVSASDEREAAARAWIRLVGEARAEYLKNLSAPAVIIAHETDACAIMEDLRESALDVADLELFNLVEIWYFCVTPPAEANRMTRTGDCRVAQCAPIAGKRRRHIGLPETHAELRFDQVA